VLVYGSAKMKVLLLLLLVLGTTELVECVVYGLLLSLTAADSGRDPASKITNTTSYIIVKVSGNSAGTFACPFYL